MAGCALFCGVEFESISGVELLGISGDKGTSGDEGISINEGTRGVKCEGPAGVERSK